MATTCFGPPPLPPSNKKKVVATVEPTPKKSSRREKNDPKSSQKKKIASVEPLMSSTYRSFRDPVEEDEIIVLSSEDMEVKPIVQKEKKKEKTQEKKYNTNSLTRPLSASKLTLTRSHSEGNLTIVGEDAPLDLSLPPLGSGALNKCLRVLSGSWKNLFQLGGMSRPNKPTVQIKKVAPPAVPDCQGFRHSGSSFGSAGYSSGEDHGFTEHGRDGYELGDVYGMAGKSPGGQFNYPAFTFPGPQYTQVAGTTKSAMYYHHQLSLQEDQGIDMTQSPGRDSPGSSGSGSRHSTASLDSGRASGCHLAPHTHPRPSLSSSSVGSDLVPAAPARVERLMLQGVPDQDVLHAWLMDIHSEEYFPLFVSAGYDMCTISRMTPEDLTAIGIKKPNHRKKLKAEIAQLNISDGLPDYIPGSLEEWLRLLRLEEYGPALACQGYNTINDVTQLTWEDLEDIGIVKLGHQKRILLAIKRVKDLRAGKVFPPPNTPVLLPHNQQPPAPAPAAECDCPRVLASVKSFHQPWEIEASRRFYCTTDIVPIKIRGGRGKSLESLEEGMAGGGGGTSSFAPTPPPPGWRPRSYDDGDITPTNEVVPLHEGGGTLPRPRGLVRPRPVAKIPATFCPAYRPEDMMMNVGTLKRLPPSPPKRQSECVTVVADLHCPAPNTWSDTGFKSSSSTESDSLPFANENAGTIKQRAVRNVTDYVPPIRVQPPSNENTLTISRKEGQEPADVLNDIGNMLANLTDELDAMLLEEKRQGLTDE